MSDFLSNFTKDSYTGKKRTPEEQADETSSDALDEAPQPSQTPREETAIPVEETPSRRQKQTEKTVSRFETEETEFDPTYKKKQQKKYLLIGAIVIVAAALIGVLYYQLTHVKVPDFKEKEISAVRTWANDEGVKVNVTQEHDFETAINSVISQSVPADKKIRKGKTLDVVGSLGPDPDEKIALPDFAKMDKTAASEWVAENKAENLTIIENYDTKIKKGAFIKQEFANKELKIEDYARKDRLKVYYSKGKEVFEKNIEVLDFKGKIVADVEEWAKKNEVKLKLVKDFSSTVADGMVISQEITKGTKIGKDEEFIVHVSKGKAMEVPDYSEYTMDEAGMLESGVPVSVKGMYSDSVPYGQFISQSIEAGKQYNETDVLPTVKVVYSEGRPYINDLRGSASEGDLAKLFFDEFTSKGAKIYYEVYYVDSMDPKGQVVEMSTYGQFISMGSTVWIGISLGNLKPTFTEQPEIPEYAPEATPEPAAMNAEIPESKAEVTPEQSVEETVTSE